MKPEAKLQICDKFLAFIESIQDISNTITSLNQSGEISDFETTRLLSAIEQILVPAETLSNRIIAFKNSINNERGRAMQS